MEHVIHRGDCRRHLARMADASIDAFVTDPPYGIELSLHTLPGRPRSIAGDGRHEARKLWADFLPHAARVAKPDSAHLFFGTWKSIWIEGLLREHFAVKGCVVWYKNTWGLGWHLRPRWELAWYCHKGKPPIPAEAMPDVWQHPRDHRLSHPCQKPVPLLRQAIRCCLPPERRDPARPPTVCDPFAGIGSTAVAAVEEGVGFVGMELDPRYVRLARDRVHTALAAAASDAKQSV